MTSSNSHARLLRRFGAGALIATMSAVPALAQNVSFRGEIGIEGRWFADSPAFPGQTSDVQTSFTIEPEVSWESDDGRHQLSFTGFLREDSLDSARSHADIREAFYRFSSGDWDITAGINRIFWGVTESRHLVNVINQIDALEDVDEEDFLGQPMIQIGRQTDIGRFDAFVLPGFREREFPSVAGRLRPALPVDASATTYESADGNDRVDLALRYSHYFGDVDLGFHVFHGTSREPTLTPSLGGDVLVAHYPVITQAGVDLQVTKDAWLWKFEGLYREGQGKSFGAFVAGVEYTMYQVGGGDADLGLIAELLYDGRDGTVFPTVFDQDLFLGGRLAFNDTADTAVLAGLLVDADHGPTYLRVEAERRLGENWSVEAAGQLFLQDNPNDPAQQFKQDSHLSLMLTRHF